MIPFPATSPFKLLQPYEQGDQHIYFGRKDETRQLTETLKRSKFILLYGASGTGKTSLIRCGLPGMISPRDWLPVFVRRNHNFIDSIKEAVNEQYLKHYQLRFPGKTPTLSDKLPLRELIKALFGIAYVPVYLILDQFEEIFTLGKLKEQKAFFAALQELRLFEEDLFCKLIISTREEYIAHFYRYEKSLPFLFEYRFRVEKMRQKQLKEVVTKTLATPYLTYPEFRIDKNAPTLILNNLPDDRSEIDLTTLQVYLDRLYHQDLKRINAGVNRDHILFDDALILANQLPNVLAEFLDRQVHTVNQRIATILQKDKAPISALQILFKMVTPQGTKQNRSATEIFQDLQLGRTTINPELLNQYLTELAQPDIRILDRLRFAKTEEERFEIVHDRLAEQVFIKFSAEENAQREAKEIIQLNLKRHTPKSPDFLSIGELELIKKNLELKRLEDNAKKFIEASETYHENKKRQQQWISIGAWVAAIVFAGVAVFAFRQTVQIKNEQEKTIQQRNIADSIAKKEIRQRYFADSIAKNEKRQRKIADSISVVNIQKEAETRMALYNFKKEQLARKKEQSAKAKLNFENLEKAIRAFVKPGFCDQANKNLSEAKILASSYPELLEDFAELEKLVQNCKPN